MADEKNTNRMLKRECCLETCASAARHSKSTLTTTITPGNELNQRNEKRRPGRISSNGKKLPASDTSPSPSPGRMIVPQQIHQADSAQDYHATPR